MPQEVVFQDLPHMCRLYLRGLYIQVLTVLVTINFIPCLPFVAMLTSLKVCLCVTQQMGFPIIQWLTLSLSEEGFNMEAGQLFCGSCYGKSYYYGATCEGCGSKIGGDLQLPWLHVDWRRVLDDR